MMMMMIFAHVLRFVLMILKFVKSTHPKLDGL